VLMTIIQGCSEKLTLRQKRATVTMIGEKCFTMVALQS
jgi:hypothetical protein